MHNDEMRYLIKYLSEILILIVSVVPIFIDLETIKSGKYLIFIAGISYAGVSVYLKFKDDESAKRAFNKLASVNKSTKKELSSEIKNTREMLGEITEKKDKEIEHFREQNMLISRLIGKGFINEKDIYEIVKSDKLFLFFCYQTIPEQTELGKILGRELRNPVLIAVEEFGFVRVGTRHNFYVMPIHLLPTKWQHTSRLAGAVKRSVKAEWKNFLTELKPELKSKNKKYHDRYFKKYKKPANFTFMLTPTNLHDLTIDHIGFNSFSPAFKDFLKGNVDLKKLRKEVARKKHAIRQFIDSISFELFLSDIPPNDLEIIIKNEGKIKKALGTTKVFDYSGREKEISEALQKFFSETKSKRYARVIESRSRTYRNLFSALGLI